MEVTRGNKRVKLPTSPTGKYNVCEFFGTGDPYFGGAADDRMLSNRGQFDARGANDVAVFYDLDAAIAAAFRAPHRKGSLVSVVATWQPLTFE